MVTMTFFISFFLFLLDGFFIVTCCLSEPKHSLVSECKIVCVGFWLQQIHADFKRLLQSTSSVAQNFENLVKNVGHLLECSEQVNLCKQNIGVCLIIMAFGISAYCYIY